VAYVIRRAGCLVEGENLKAHVLTQLARFKGARDIVFVDDLPRTASGQGPAFHAEAACRNGKTMTESITLVMAGKSAKRVFAWMSRPSTSSVTRQKDARHKPGMTDE